MRLQTKIFMNFNTVWDVLYLKFRWERKVCESLKEVSLETFLLQVKQSNNGVIEIK